MASDKDLDDIIDTLIGEAAAGGLDEMVRVGWVIKNRADKYGVDPGEVVRAKTPSGGWEFDGYKGGANREKRSDAMRELAKTAWETVQTSPTDPTNGATYFVSPTSRLAPAFAANGLQQVAIDGALHNYFTDPQSRPISTEQGVVRAVQQVAQANVPAPVGRPADAPAMPVPPSQPFGRPDGVPYVQSIPARAGVNTADLDPDTAARVAWASREYEKIYGEPLMVRSGARTPEQQQALRRAGAPAARNSAHVQGLAVDFDLTGMTPQQKETAVDLAARAGINRLGAYSGETGLHADMRPQRQPDGSPHPMFNESIRNMPSAPGWFTGGMERGMDAVRVGMMPTFDNPGVSVPPPARRDDAARARGRDIGAFDPPAIPGFSNFEPFDAGLYRSVGFTGLDDPRAAAAHEDINRSGFRNPQSNEDRYFTEMLTAGLPVQNASTNAAPPLSMGPPRRTAPPSPVDRVTRNIPSRSMPSLPSQQPPSLDNYIMGGGMPQQPQPLDAGIMSGLPTVGQKLDFARSNLPTFDPKAKDEKAYGAKEKQASKLTQPAMPTVPAMLDVPPPAARPQPRVQEATRRAVAAALPQLPSMNVPSRPVFTPPPIQLQPPPAPRPQINPLTGFPPGGGEQTIMGLGWNGVPFNTATGLPFGFNPALERGGLTAGSRDSFGMLL